MLKIQVKMYQSYKKNKNEHTRTHNVSIRIVVNLTLEKEAAFGVDDTTERIAAEEAAMYMCLYVSVYIQEKQ